MGKLNIKLAALWLSEAWGEDIPQSHIRVRKGWIFVRYPKYVDDKESLYDPTWDGYGYRQIRQGWEDEVDCINAPIPHPTQPGMVISNDICAEPWSDVRYIDSPFVPHNDERVTKAIAILDKKYKEYLQEYEENDEQG